MKIWIVTTCIPERGAEPCQPMPFKSGAEAEAYADKMLRDEWASYAEWDEEDEAKQVPYPGDWREANNRLSNFYDDGSWGSWQITEHEI